jgi:hypothetical protein
VLEALRKGMDILSRKERDQIRWLGRIASHELD